MVAGRQVPVPSLLTFKILYTQAPTCNSLTLVLQCSLQQEARNSNQLLFALQSPGSNVLSPGKSSLSPQAEPRLP